MGDDFFQALANPYRREIIRLLKWRSRTAGEIAAHFSISQPSISRHLDVLKRAEIITAERRGNQILYTLNLSVVQEMVVQLTDLLGRKEETCHETEGTQGPALGSVPSDPGGRPAGPGAGRP